MKVPLFRPELGKEELENIGEVFKSHWIGLGPKVAEFEEKFAEFIGVKYAVAVNSGTAALHLAVKVLGIGQRDEVIVPAITMAASAHAVLYCGAKPVFCDVDEKTLCLDTNDFKRKITERTKAVIPVHLGGEPCLMDEIMKIARSRGLFVIEDVANAVGGSYKNKKLGSIGDIGCHSFEAKKNMTTGDGGMLTLNSRKLTERLRKLRWYGASSDTWERLSKGNKKRYSWFYDVEEIGYKYNMNDISAAIGLAQLKNLPSVIKKKEILRKKYFQALQDIPWLELPAQNDYAGKASYWLFIAKLKERDKFIDFMHQNGITTGVHFMPVQFLSVYKKYKTKLPKAERVWRKIVSLPFFASITDKEFDYVQKTIKRFKN